MNNKLYCTFIEEEEVDVTIDEIIEEYEVLFNKIFVLSSLDEDKLMLTYNIDSPLRRCPNINKASSKLGFKPFTNLKKGIIKTLSYHKSKKI